MSFFGLQAAGQLVCVEIIIRWKEFTSNLFEIIFSFKIDVNETIRRVFKLMFKRGRL